MFEALRNLTFGWSFGGESRKGGCGCIVWILIIVGLIMYFGK